MLDLLALVGIVMARLRTSDEFAEWRSVRKADPQARFRRLRLRDRMIHGAGKVRRVYLSALRSVDVARSREQQVGSCRQCGACCRLMFRCPYLHEMGGYHWCAIHDSRPVMCRNFPIDARDIADRDRVLPDLPCGFSATRRRERRLLDPRTWRRPRRT